jgi:autotransporter-associated beta strand protein
MKIIKTLTYKLNQRFSLIGHALLKISFLVLVFTLIMHQSINAQTYYSNITVGTSSGTITTTTGGSWTFVAGSNGSSSNPWVFTPNASTAFISQSDLQSKLNTTGGNGNVTITTTMSSGTSSNTGTVIFTSTITGTSATTSVQTFKITANSTITINTGSALALTTNTDATNNTYKVTNIDFTSTIGDIVINSPIQTIPAATSAAANGTTGGNVTLTAAGVINVTSTGAIQTNGQQNTNGAYHDVGGSQKAWSGGYGGNIILNGTGGISLAGVINASAGVDVLNTGGYEYTYPGSLTVNTNATSTNIGQTSATNTIYIGNLVKKGTGTFQVYAVGYGGRSLANDSTYNSYDTVYSGMLQLMAANALTTRNITGSAAFADLVVTSPGTFELNGFSQSLGTISGNGTTTSSSGNPTLTLTYNNNKRITVGSTLFTTYSGLISGSLSINKNFSQNSAGNYQSSVLVLSNNNNSYTGTTTISQGIIRITSAGALGSYASGQGTIIANRGVLEISGGLTINEPLNIKGIGDNADAYDPTSFPANTGAVKSISGTNTLNGAIVLDSTAKISSYGSVAADSLIISSTINTSTSTNTLNIDGIRGVNITGIISGLGGLNKSGANTTLRLTAANTYKGITKVTAGTLLLNAANRIDDLSDLYFNGGDFNTGGFSETLNNVYVTAAGSTLTLGSTPAHTLLFAGSDNSFVDNYVKIIGWQGTYVSPGSTGSVGKIQFTNKQTSLQSFCFL